jgi:hypothetical protein
MMQGVPIPHHRHHVNGIEQSTGEPIVTGGHIRQLDVTPLQSGNESGSTVFRDVNFNAWMALPVPRQKTGEHCLDHGRCRANPDYPGVPRFEREGSLAQGLGVGKQLTAAPEQVFAFARQSDTATDAIEQLHTEFGFQHLDLPGSRRLAQVEACRGPGDATSVGNCDEGAQLVQVHD